MGVNENSKVIECGCDEAGQVAGDLEFQDAESPENLAAAMRDPEVFEEDSDGGDLEEGASEESEPEEGSPDESDLDDLCEEIELEFSEDDIVSYLVDEDDNEIGFTLLDEDGNEIEYYYVEEDVEEDAGDGKEENPYDLGITKEGVAQATNDMNAIYKDGIAVATELKGALDDIKSAFDFTSVLKKK